MQEKTHLHHFAKSEIAMLEYGLGLPEPANEMALADAENLKLKQCRAEKRSRLARTKKQTALHKQTLNVCPTIT